MKLLRSSVTILELHRSLFFSYCPSLWQLLQRFRAHTLVGGSNRLDRGISRLNKRRGFLL